MKQTRLLTILAAGVLCTAALGTALGQQQLRSHQPQTGPNPAAATAGMATATGTIVTYTPASDHFMFRPSPNAAPVRYYHTKNTVIVDAEGRAVDQSEIRPGVGATMYYTTSGDRMIVRKVVLGQAPAASEKKAGKTETKKGP